MLRGPHLIHEMGMDANLQMIAKIAAICNNANVEQSDNQFVTRGMPTEADLKVSGLLHCLATFVFN